MDLQKSKEETGTDFDLIGGIPEDVPKLFWLVQQLPQFGGRFGATFSAKVAENLNRRKKIQMDAVD